MSIKTNPHIPSDMTNMSPEEQIRLLNQMIDKELKKTPEEADNNLIAECTDYINMLLQQTEQAPAETLDRIYGLILSGKAKQSDKRQKKGKTIVWRTVAILVAAFLLLFGALSVAAAVQGYANAAELVKAKIEELFGMEFGDTVQYENITIIKNGNYTVYSTYEEFAKAENLSILISTGLSEELTPVKILMYDTDNAGHNIIEFFFSSNVYGISVQNQYTFTDLSALKGSVTYTTLAGYVFTVIPINEACYQAISQKDGYEYIITAPNEPTLQELMNSMKEVS